MASACIVPAMWAYVGAHPVLWRVACACGHACQAVGEADVHTRMQRRESIKPHVKQTQHVLLPLPLMGSFYPRWPGGERRAASGERVHVPR